MNSFLYTLWREACLWSLFVLFCLQRKGARLYFYYVNPRPQQADDFIVSVRHRLLGMTVHRGIIQDIETLDELFAADKRHITIRIRNLKTNPKKGTASGESIQRTRSRKSNQGRNHCRLGKIRKGDQEAKSFR